MFRVFCSKEGLDGPYFVAAIPLVKCSQIFDSLAEIFTAISAYRLYDQSHLGIQVLRLTIPSFLLP